MSQFLVSARKYRPSKFVDVVGQQHITTTLKNAIKSEQVAQSFLFCGPRGVGKTTCARILAKVLNCENQTEDFEPCNECGSCTSFNQNASFNIFELDAASNNSVEDIRQLIEQVRFAPQTGKYKVYIIDEVHMLSSAAFNAFLKTLEEPPSYAIFILATTEKHKLLPTIISRCQVFDFHRITNQAIVEHLSYIAKEEDTEVETEALHIVAQKADGGLRDALSIYDRMSSFSAGKITYQSVLENLNVLDYDYFFKITDNVLLQDRSALMLTLDEILRNGFDGGEFINGLASHLRNLMMAKSPNTVNILEVSDNWRIRYEQQAQNLATGFILSCLNLANNCALGFRDAKNKRLQIELALLKMCYINQAIDLSRQAPANALPMQQQAPAAIQQATSEKKNDVGNSTQNPPIIKPIQQAPPNPIQTPSPTINKVEEKIPPIVEKPNVTASNKFKLNSKFKTGSNSNGNNLKLNGSLDDITQNLQAEIKGKAKPELDYSPQNIVELWKNYVANHDSPRTQGVLQEHEIAAVNNMLTTTTNSTFNQAELQNEMKKFIEFLKVSYESVVLKYEVAYVKGKEDNLPKKVYTIEDKYKVMAAKNPALETLKTELGLELEY